MRALQPRRTGTSELIVLSVSALSHLRIALYMALLTAEASARTCVKDATPEEHTKASLSLPSSSGGVGKGCG